MKLRHQLYDRTSEILGLERKQVQEAYESVWKFIRSNIESQDFKSSESLADLGKTSFSLPVIGKLGCTESRYNKVKQRRNKKH